MLLLNNYYFQKYNWLLKNTTEFNRKILTLTSKERVGYRMYCCIEKYFVLVFSKSHSANDQ